MHCIDHAALADTSPPTSMPSLLRACRTHAFCRRGNAAAVRVLPAHRYQLELCGHRWHCAPHARADNRMLPASLPFSPPVACGTIAAGYTSMLLNTGGVGRTGRATARCHMVACSYLRVYPAVTWQAAGNVCKPSSFLFFPGRVKEEERTFNILFSCPPFTHTAHTCRACACLATSPLHHHLPHHLCLTFLPFTALQSKTLPPRLPALHCSTCTHILHALTAAMLMGGNRHHLSAQKHHYPMRVPDGLLATAHALALRRAGVPSRCRSYRYHMQRIPP